MLSAGFRCLFGNRIRAVVEGVTLKLLPTDRLLAAVLDRSPKVVHKRAPAVVGAVSGPPARRAGTGAGLGLATAEERHQVEGVTLKPEWLNTD